MPVVRFCFVRLDFLEITIRRFREEFVAVFLFGYIQWV